MTVQRDIVVKRLADMKAAGNEDGLIPAFNALADNLPAAFWNTLTVRLMDAAPRSSPARRIESRYRKNNTRHL